MTQILSGKSFARLVDFRDECERAGMDDLASALETLLIEPAELINNRRLRIRTDDDIRAERREFARRELVSRLDDIRDFSNDENDFDGVYCVESRRTVVLTLAGGGPSAWIDYEPDHERATFYTTAPGYTESAPTTSIDLTRGEIDLIEPYGYAE